MTTVNAVAETQSANPHWQWCNWNDLSYLTCSLLQDWQHGFFTHSFYPRTPKQLIETLNPNAGVYRVKQVHGDLVLTPKEIETTVEHQNNSYPDGDGLISDRARQSVWVASADCNPVLIGDVATGKVAAVHAGWRGTAQKIVPKAIARLIENGSIKDNLRIAMGPAIAGEVYQVDEVVAIKVGKTIIPELIEATNNEILAKLRYLPDSPLLPDYLPGKVRLDVRRVNQLQLEQLGISSEQIAIAPFCTYQQSERFFSYRRSGEKKVQWSGIVSKS